MACVYDGRERRLVASAGSRGRDRGGRPLGTRRSPVRAARCLHRGGGDLGPAHRAARFGSVRERGGGHREQAVDRSGRIGGGGGGRVGGGAARGGELQPRGRAGGRVGGGRER